MNDNVADKMEEMIASEQKTRNMAAELLHELIDRTDAPREMFAAGCAFLGFVLGFVTADLNEEEQEELFQVAGELTLSYAKMGSNVVHEIDKAEGGVH